MNRKIQKKKNQKFIKFRKNEKNQKKSKKKQLLVSMPSSAQHSRAGKQGSREGKGKSLSRNVEIQINK